MKKKIGYIYHPWHIGSEEDVWDASLPNRKIRGTRLLQNFERNAFWCKAKMGMRLPFLNIIIGSVFSWGRRAPFQMVLNTHYVKSLSTDRQITLDERNLLSPRAKTKRLSSSFVRFALLWFYWALTLLLSRFTFLFCIERLWSAHRVRSSNVRLNEDIFNFEFAHARSEFHL